MITQEQAETIREQLRANVWHTTGHDTVRDIAAGIIEALGGVEPHHTQGACRLEGEPVVMPSHQFLWLAIETTATKPSEGVILEIAAALAEDDKGGDLSVVREWSAVTDEPYDPDLLDEAVVSLHLANGLLEAPATASLVAFDARPFGVLAEMTGKAQPTGIVLAGLTAAWTLPWIHAYMPRLASCLAFGALDIGSLNKAAKAWHPEPFRAHYIKADRALPKVHAALASARHWREAVGL